MYIVYVERRCTYRWLLVTIGDLFKKFLIPYASQFLYNIFHLP